jgi:hypothetical protein
VSRHKKTVFVFMAVMMLLAAGAPASAETYAARQQRQVGAEVVRKQTSVLPMWWRAFVVKLKSRYAMAAN